jgi:hypothetical protein
MMNMKNRATARPPRREQPRNISLDIGITRLAPARIVEALLHIDQKQSSIRR